MRNTFLPVEHNAYQLQGQSYVKSAAILATSAEYNNPLGLKTATKFYNPVGTGFSLQRTESYGYDQDFDYLTSVNYGDGSAVQTWEYDAAGNRSSASANPGTWSYDNLNRMTASPGVTYDHDSLGNRMLKTSAGNSTAYGWDAVNRMTSIGPLAGTKTQYSYRADGMRVKKVLPGGDVTRSYYDGQMPVEEDSVVTGTSTVTRNFVGARGIEAIFTTITSGTTTAFPLYDCHGNMVATIARSGPGFTTSNVRTYDVWGGVRTGASTGGPKGRYVANLGHVQDDESGLIYMRARYYEPESGRFISEDPAMDGVNWYLYANNDPSNQIDRTGRSAELQKVFSFGLWLLGLSFFVTGWAAMSLGNQMKNYVIRRAQYIHAVKNHLRASVLCFALAAIGADIPYYIEFGAALIAGLTLYDKLIDSIMTGIFAGQRKSANQAVFAVALYGLVILGFILAMDVE